MTPLFPFIAPRKKKFTAGLLAFGFFAVTFGLGAFAQDPEITVYNQNFGLVKDYRALPLKKGVNQVELDDVAGLIDPTSVHFKSLTAPKSVQVLEQNFRYDLINKNTILDRMVGQKIRFRKNGVTQTGTLLNPATSYFRPTGYSRNRYSHNYNKTNNSHFAIQTDDGILLTTLGDIIIEELPEGLYPRPTLLWDLYSTKGGTHQSEVSYLTDGLNWHSDYVAVINKDDTRIDLTGWVTLDNQSGMSYDNAKLKLVAGDVRKIQNQNGNMAMGAVAFRSMDALKKEARQFKEESFFEYHLYTLSDRTDIKNHETKQVTLISANQIPLKKTYIYDPGRTNYHRWRFSGWRGNYYGTPNYYGRPGQGYDTSEQKKINTLLTVKNTKNNRLGIPLPKGRVRVNKADQSGSLQFVGEDWIDHTPEDEKIELYVGDAFDLVGEKKRLNYRKEAKFIEETYEVKLRNHKKNAPVTITVVDHLFGDWKMITNNVDYTQEDAHTIHMPVSVPTKGERVITYTVRIKRL